MTFEGIDKGPQDLDEEAFNRECLRCGRTLNTDGDIICPFNPNERLNQKVSWSHCIFHKSKSHISSQASTCGGGQASTPVSTSSSPMIRSSLPSKYVKKHDECPAQPMKPPKFRVTCSTPFLLGRFYISMFSQGLLRLRI